MSMAILNYQLNPTDKFELKQAIEALQKALDYLLKEEEKRSKEWNELGKLQGLPKVK